MARWEPDARGRLEAAAMELFQERGYVETTVEDIAARAGLTQRTFFRHFADKREVLFSGSAALEKTIVDALASAPPDASPLDAVVSAFEAAGVMMEAYRDLAYVRARYVLVAKHAEILERELIKLAALAGSVTRGLRARGVAEPAASLAAEAGVAVFKVGFDTWVNEKKPRDFPGHIRKAVAGLRQVTAAGQGKTVKQPTRTPRTRATRPR